MKTSIHPIIAAAALTACCLSMPPLDAGAAESRRNQSAKVQLKPMSARLDFGPKPLTGSVSHSQAVAPVKKELRAGATFNQEMLPKKLDQEWYWIPDWRAGLWQSTVSTLDYGFEYRGQKTHPRRQNVPDRSLEYYGFQKDRRGGIWDFVGTPRYQVVDTGQWREIQLIEKAEPVSVSSKKITKMFRGKVFRINPYTSVIMHVEQSESLQTYEPVGPGRIKRVSSTKVFDENGRATAIRKTTTYFFRQSAYRPINYHQGQDMRVSLRNFLSRNGLKDRL